MSSIDVATARREADFLDKLLQIRDEVLTNTHPRIKLPPSVLEKLAGPPPNQLFAASLNRAPSGRERQQQHSLPPRPEYSAQHPKDYNPPSHAPRPVPPKPSASGIDPVLLTKSDHLIRAELQLKRQYIERTLRDQLDKKGRAAFAEDRETYLDVDDVLTKAQALVPPISGLTAAVGDSEESTSFDENSYYSSQANSWSHGERSPIPTPHSANVDDTLPTQAQQFPAEALTAASAVDHIGIAQTQPTVIDLEEEPYEPAEDIEVYEPEAIDVDQEESDYSPPPAATAPSEMTSKGRLRTRGVEAGTTGSRRQSPAGLPAPIQNPRKRRRAEAREERRRQQENKRVVRSPEPFIKEEPQSPPPFAGYPDLQPSKRRAVQAPLVEPEPAPIRGSRMQPIHYQELDHSPRSYRLYDEPQSPSVMHPPQRLVERDDQDLRRVASLQHARRPYSPRAREVYPGGEMRQVRAASQAFAERPLEPIYGEVSRHASVAPRFVGERSRSPVREYLPRAHSPGPMAPPPRTIVVDQYGNRYYAAPVEVRESVAPLRRIEAEPYYERGVTREPTLRAAGRDLYEEEGVMRMPPPPPPRRYVEVADSEVMEGRAYRMREASHRPLEADYVGSGVGERRPLVQYEEMGARRDHVHVPSRAYSMRPEGVRREVGEEYVPLRHGSMAPRQVSVAGPRYREISVVHQEPPHEGGRYTFSQAQGRRYVEEPSSERLGELAPEPYGGEARRVSYRY